MHMCDVCVVLTYHCICILETTAAYNHISIHSKYESVYAAEWDIDDNYK